MSPLMMLQQWVFTKGKSTLIIMFRRSHTCIQKKTHCMRANVILTTKPFSFPNLNDSFEFIQGHINNCGHYLMKFNIQNTCSYIGTFFRSFTIEAWLKLDTGYTAGPYPVLCTSNASMCMWIENGYVYGQYGTDIVTSSTTLAADTWYNVIFRNSIEGKCITINMQEYGFTATRHIKVF